MKIFENHRWSIITKIISRWNLRCVSALNMKYHRLWAIQMRPEDNVSESTLSLWKSRILKLLDSLTASLHPSAFCWGLAKTIGWRTDGYTEIFPKTNFPTPNFPKQIFRHQISETNFPTVKIFLKVYLYININWICRSVSVNTYVSKFLLNKSHISEYGLYCSMLKWWYFNNSYRVIFVDGKIS